MTWSRLARPLVAGRSCLGVAMTLTMFLGTARTASADDETGVLSSRHKSYESPQNFAFEVRVGPYHPRVDTAPALGQTGPYQAIFGDSLRWEVAVEFDWQAYRIPHFGTIGPGISVGYTSSSALAPLVHPVNGSTLSGESTSLTIYPTYGVAVLRIDVLSRELHVPFVPYLKAGFGLAFWEASNTAGVSKYAPTNSKGATTGPSVTGEGNSYGEQLAIGMAIDLNFLDRRTSQGFDNATGVNHTFIFGELQDYNLTSSTNPGGAMYVGNQNWLVGLGFEF
jgi:hypothetical protein